MPPMLMKNDQDPRKVIYDKIGLTTDLKIPGFQLLGNRVMVGVYERPSITKSGIHLADVSRQEDLHQGKAGLVVALGPTAFVSDDHFQFGDEDKLKIGDWCMLFVSYGLRCVVNGQVCRIIRDQDITMKIPAPDQVW